MIEINGWITLLIGGDEDNNLEATQIAVNKVKGLIQNQNDLNQMFRVENLNGMNTLFLGICHNHNLGYSDLVLKLVNDITQIANGSYGMIYYRDQDNLSSYDKFFIVKVAKGKVTVEEDKLLSPCSKIIES